jgi:RNA polymerase sigma factor (sigma-70 family)
MVARLTPAWAGRWREENLGSRPNIGVGCRFERITGDWTLLVTGSAQSGRELAGLGSALASRPAGWGSPGGDQTDPVGDDATVLAESLRQPERFGHIYDRHFPGIYGYIASRLGPDDADDLTAETFVDAFRRRASFDPARGQVRPWLFGIATRLVAQHRRAEARRYRALARIPAEPDPGGHDEQVAAQVSAQARREPLLRALAGLSDEDRDVLLLVAVGGLSYQEVAVALSIPPGTVASRLNRARGKVRGVLGLPHSSQDDRPDDHGGSYARR